MDLLVSTDLHLTSSDDFIKLFRLIWLSFNCKIGILSVFSSSYIKCRSRGRERRTRRLEIDDQVRNTNLVLVVLIL